MSDAASGEPREESVTALLHITERIVDDERARGANLTSKTATLAGFSGTILSVVAVLGRALFELDLGRLAEPMVSVLFLMSVLALATAATLAIGGVLRPQTRLVVQTEEVLRFAAPPWSSADPVEIKGNMLASLAQALEQEASVERWQGPAGGLRCPLSSDRLAGARRSGGGARRHGAAGDLEERELGRVSGRRAAPPRTEAVSRSRWGPTGPGGGARSHPRASSPRWS